MQQATREAVPAGAVDQEVKVDTAGWGEPPHRLPAPARAHAAMPAAYPLQKLLPPPGDCLQRTDAASVPYSWRARLPWGAAAPAAVPGCLRAARSYTGKRARGVGIGNRACVKTCEARGGRPAALALQGQDLADRKCGRQCNQGSGARAGSHTSTGCGAAACGICA